MVQCTQSETFSYWNTVINMVHILKDLVRADREGNLELHLRSIQLALPMFAGCDRINYLRWASVYLEDMRDSVLLGLISASNRPLTDHKKEQVAS